MCFDRRLVEIFESLLIIALWRYLQADIHYNYCNMQTNASFLDSHVYCSMITRDPPSQLGQVRSGDGYVMSLSGLGGAADRIAWLRVPPRHLDGVCPVPDDTRGTGTSPG